MVKQRCFEKILNLNFYLNSLSQISCFLSSADIAIQDPLFSRETEHHHHIQQQLSGGVTVLEGELQEAMGSVHCTVNRHIVLSLTSSLRSNGGYNGLWVGHLRLAEPQEFA